MQETAIGIISSVVAVVLGAMLVWTLKTVSELGERMARVESKVDTLVAAAKEGCPLHDPLESKADGTHAEMLRHHEAGDLHFTGNKAAS